MAQKKKAGSQSEVRAAWNRVRQALTRAEASMTALIEANKALLRSLGKAGASVTQNARTELNARIRKLEKNRQNARKQLNALAKRFMAMGKKPAARARPKARRK
jgi:hypothetical protein